jgi:hypothetical protein
MHASNVEGSQRLRTNQLQSSGCSRKPCILTRELDGDAKLDRFLTVRENAFDAIHMLHGAKSEICRRANDDEPHAVN